MSKYNWIDLSGSITFGLHETFKWAPSGPKKKKKYDNKQFRYNDKCSQYIIAHHKQRLFPYCYQL